MSLPEIDPSWRSRAACGPESDTPIPWTVFFPGELDPGDEGDDDLDPHLSSIEAELAGEVAANYCRACPARLTCVEVALDYGRENHGIWGGIGSAHRRRLLQIRYDMGEAGEEVHRYTPGCDCRFCATLESFLAGELLDRNTTGARHGYLATYDRGCRCRGCRFIGYHNSRRRTVARLEGLAR